jgi:uncharacterized ion transporter superfamily protein YfcC
METEKNIVPVKKKAWLKVPHTYTLIFIIIILAGLASYVIPAGEFDRVEDEESGRMLVVDGSYHAIEQDPVSFFDLFTSIPLGLEKGAQIIFYIFLVSGSNLCLSGRNFLLKKRTSNTRVKQ